MPLNILTFNIGGARKLRQPPHNPQQVAADAAEVVRGVLDPSLPTLVGVQEATNWLQWVGDSAEDGAARNSTRQLAAALGNDYRVGFAAEVTAEMHPHARLWHRPAYIHPERGTLEQAHEGNAIVGNLPWTGWPWPSYTGCATVRRDSRALYPIVTQISGAVLYSTGSRDTQPRNLMVACVRHDEYGPLYFMNTHLGTVSGEDRHDPNHPQSQIGTRQRIHQMQQILAVVHELRTAEATHNVPPRPLILVGDFNALPGSAPMNVLTAEMDLLPVDTPEDQRWSHVDHQILIDHVLVQDPQGILPEGRASVVTDHPHTDLTDHRPVVATFA
jgi:endonuclease/exonuclease/phosphatase family metal-dependent hydrolase